MADQKIVDFDAVSKASESGSPLIIDVRNPGEYASGHIPRSVNIPVGICSEAFQLGAEEFKEKYGIDLPGKDADLILSCKSGARAGMAKGTLESIGFTKVLVYSGSFSDWAARDGPVEKEQ